MKRLILFCFFLTATAFGQSADEILSPHFSRYQPGCSVSVRRDGQVVFEKGYGAARLEPRPILNTARTRMRMASVTKPVLSMGILHLRDQLLGEGQPDPLYETLGTIYPSLQNTSSADITVHQLMNHTSGFTREPVYADREEFLIVEILFRSLMKEFSPSGKYEYSNLAYMLLGDILSTKSGVHWHEYLRRHIFEPLGMNRTSVEDPVPLRESGRMAMGYVARREGGFKATVIDDTRRYMLGSGGLISTAQDMSRLAAAIEQGQILSPAAWQLTFEPSPATFDGESGYGLGWTVRNVRRTKERWHYGGGYGALTLLKLSTQRTPHCRFSIAMLCNFDKGTIPFDHKAVPEQIRQVYCLPH